MATRKPRPASVGKNRIVASRIRTAGFSPRPEAGRVRRPATSVELRFAGLPPGAWRPSRARVASLLREMIRAAGAAPAGVSVLLVGDAAIRGLNRRFRGIDRPTDVLSFGVPRSRRAAAPEPAELGDLVVSLPTCRRQALALRCPPLDRLVHLLAHGLLHLLGRDHRTSREFAAMERRTRRLVESALGPGSSARARGCGLSVDNL